MRSVLSELKTNKTERLCERLITVHKLLLKYLKQRKNKQKCNKFIFQCIYFVSTYFVFS